MGRKAVLLENEKICAIVETMGGMVPVLGPFRGSSVINAHWVPDFRSSSGEKWAEEKHGPYWTDKVLFNLAGDFTTCPSFGAPCTVDGISMPTHGWAANEEWSIDGIGGGEGVAWVDFSLASPVPEMPLVFQKRDIIFDGQDAYYSALTVRNNGARPLAINIGRHNTLGGQFLQAGCTISECADRFMTPPKGTEFDDTGRLAFGAEFPDLSAAPLRTGGTADVSVVPGMIGATDLVVGAIPDSLSLGWNCTVNPILGLAYMCFFPGARATEANEIALSFNDLWLQYGGRPFTPWAMAEGTPDRSFCLGTENSVGAFANGLAYSRAHPELLGRPTTIEVAAGGWRRLLYGTAVVELKKDLIREGVRSMEAERGAVVMKGSHTHERHGLEGDFDRIRSVL